MKIFEKFCEGITNLDLIILNCLFIKLKRKEKFPFLKINKEKANIIKELIIYKQKLIVLNCSNNLNYCILGLNIEGLKFIKDLIEIDKNIDIFFFSFNLNFLLGAFSALLVNLLLYSIKFEQFYTLVLSTIFLFVILLITIIIISNIINY
jgi:hypothetical protein